MQRERRQTGEGKRKKMETKIDDLFLISVSPIFHFLHPSNVSQYQGDIETAVI
jgi:hypothetical protein